MEQKKLEAESKLTAKKFGAEKLGVSWFKALQEEFRKPYMQKVCVCMCASINRYHSH